MYILFLCPLIKLQLSLRREFSVFSHIEGRQEMSSQNLIFWCFNPIKLQEFSDQHAEQESSLTSLCLSLGHTMGDNYYFWFSCGSDTKWVCVEDLVSSTINVQRWVSGEVKGSWGFWAKQWISSLRYSLLEAYKKQNLGLGIHSWLGRGRRIESSEQPMGCQWLYS